MSTLADILASDLILEKWHFEERSGASNLSSYLHNFIEVDCVVHDDWLNSVTSSSNLPLPRCPSSFSHEEIHWMLQPSCPTIPDHPWHRVHICSFRKPDISSTSNRPHKRFLVPQAVPNTDSIHTFLTTIAHETTLASLRDITKRLDETNQNEDSQAEIRRKRCPPLHSSSYMHQLVKALYDKKVKSIIPNSSDTVETDTQSSEHSSPSITSLLVNLNANGGENLSPLLAALESDNAFHLIYKYNRFTLFDCVFHSPAMLEGSAKPLIVIYQMLKLLLYCHSKGVTLGDINLKNIYIDGRLWIQYYIPPSAINLSSQVPQSELESGSSQTSTSIPDSSPVCSTENDVFEYVVKKSSNYLADYVPPALSLADAVIKWQAGEITNFDYLMLLNYQAGRRLGDPNNHPIFPWVTDFRQRNGILRDLSCSKHRLSKGDRQLEFTYHSAMEEFRRSFIPLGIAVPHHIGDIASDVTYYVYLARQTPKEVLCSRVRPCWVPEEYPSSIEKMYDWTPDECIPEFYACPEIFDSIHVDLPDLGVPDWCSSPEELVKTHRNLLESDPVSSSLNYWIDIVFGYKLSGDAAIKAKNVYLSLVDGHTAPCNSGIVQLFRSSHPKRLQNCSAPVVIFHWQRYLAMSSLMNITSFNIPQVGNLRRGVSREEKKETLASLLYKGTVLRTPEPSQMKGNLDDGSFEHVPYPYDLDEQTLNSMTPDLSILPSEIFYDAGMLSRPVKSGSGRLSDVTNPSEAVNKQGLLRGILRPKRPINNELSTEGFDWQQSSIVIPKDSHSLQPLIQVEELAHFLNRSCHDYGQLCDNWWQPQHLLMLQKRNEDSLLSHKLLKLLQEVEDGVYHSFEERVLLDIVAIVCVIVETTCNKHLRSSLPLNGSLFERYKSIRKLIIQGQLYISYYLRSLTDLIFKDEVDTTLPILEIFPNIAPSSLIQQFIPLLSFPSYFEVLYELFSKTERKCRLSGLATPPIKHKFSILNEEIDPHKEVEIAKVMNFIAETCNKLLPKLDQDGLQLLMLHIFPLFEHPSSCFEAVFNLFDPLSEYLGKKWIQQMMVPPILYVFDTFNKLSHRCNLLSRSMADKLLSRFGLAIFLNRFLTCIIEAVIEPMGLKMTDKRQPLSQVRGESLISSTKTEEKPQTQTRQVSLSHIANALSPTRTTSSAKLSLTFSWENQESPNDEDDSDIEGDFSFPEASLFAVKIQTSVLSLLDDIEQQDCGVQDQEGSKENIHEQMIDKQEEVSTILVPDPSSPTDISSNTSQKQLSVDSESDKLESLSNLPPVHPTSLPVQISKEDNLMSNSLEDEALLPPSQKEPELLHSLPLSSSRKTSIDDAEEGEGQELEGDIVSTTEVPVDPRILVMSSRISEVASDCLVWLLWRLGPILATKHIGNPLLENIHRCFNGVCKARENGNTNSVLYILASLVEYYGDHIVLHLYIPFIKKQVTNLIKRTTINAKAEAGVAASVALLEMSINKTKSDETLLEFMEDICIAYFEPLFQLLCSKKHAFPSGTKARLTICHSSVQLLKHICEKLGRIRASEVVMQALQCFFNCFSMAHDKDTSNNILTPVEGHFGRDEGGSSVSGSSPPESYSPIAIEEVKQTFSPDMIHQSYVDFCKLIGQISLTNHLRNIDVIEDLHASYSQEKRPENIGALPTLLGITDNEVEESSSSSSNSTTDESDTNLDLTYQLGPSTAIQGRSGLGRDSITFGGPSWFVDMDDTDSGVEKPSSIIQSQTTPSHHSTLVSTLMNTLQVPTVLGSSQFKTQSEPGGGQLSAGTLENQGTTMMRGSALFDAKFGAVDSNTTDSPWDKDAVENKCILQGNWAQLWKSQADHDSNRYDLYERFKELKLQSFNGHKSAIKSLYVLDSEHLFLSGSKDRTIKIWSLHNQGDGSAYSSARGTYSVHQRTVWSVDMVNNQQNVVSCDGSVHLWDPETCYSIYQFISPRVTTQFLAMDVLPESPSSVLVATNDFNLRLIDIRSKHFQHLWKTHFPTGGAIRFLVSCGTWVAAGNVNGVINIIDIRSGELLYHWKPADKWPLPPSAWSENLLQLKVTPHGNLLTSAGTGLISLWKPNSKPLNHFRGQTSNTPCLETFGEQLVTISNNGYVLVHGSFEYVRDNIVSSTRVRGKEMRNITCSAALQQNQLILFGSETGQIVLMA